MKKQRYIVEIEMPYGDFISAGWLKDLIQTDCDVEDESRKKVTVQETSLPSNLDEAAQRIAYDVCKQLPNGEEKDGIVYYAILAAIAGAKWMAGQGAELTGTVHINGMGQAYLPPEYIYLSDMDLREGDKVVVQIRKK